MRSKPAAFYIPKDFDPTIFPDALREYAYYFLNVLHWRWVCWRANEAGFVQLKYDYLAKFIPRKLFLAIKQTLIDAGIIECDSQFIVGSKCLGYRVAPPYRNTHRVICANDQLNRKIQQYESKASKGLLPVHRWLRDKLDLVDFDMHLARSIIPRLRPDEGSTLSVAEYQQQRIEHAQRLADKDYWFSCDRYGRVHTPITSLEKELRCCMSVNGRPLVGVDLANSQPLIAGICACRFFKSKYARHRLSSLSFDGHGHPYCYKLVQEAGIILPPKDVQDYTRCCETGAFYESFLRPGQDRNRFKVQFYRDVLFGKNSWQSAIKSAFTAMCPSVAQMLEALKRKNYRRSAWILQNLEATLFIHAIGGRIMKEAPGLPVFTIHDSLLTLPEHIDYVEGIIRAEFKKVGVIPTLKQEVYSHERYRATGS